MSHDLDEAGEAAVAKSYAALREGRLPPAPVSIAERFAQAQRRACVIAFATGRDAEHIKASLRSGRVMGMPKGWPVVLPRFGGVSRAALMASTVADRFIERAKTPRPAAPGNPSKVTDHD